MHFVGEVCICCRVGWVGARFRKRAGLGYRLVRKHARNEMLGLIIFMFLGLGLKKRHYIVDTCNTVFSGNFTSGFTFETGRVY